MQPRKHPVVALLQPQRLRHLFGEGVHIVGGAGVEPVADERLTLADPAKLLPGAVDQFPRSPRPTALMRAALMVVTMPG